MATTASQEQIDRFNPPIPTPQAATENLIAVLESENNPEATALLELTLKTAQKTQRTISRLAIGIGFTPALIEISRFVYFVASNPQAFEIEPSPEKMTFEFMAAIGAIMLPWLAITTGSTIGGNVAGNILRQAVVTVDNARLDQQDNLLPPPTS